MYSFEYSVSAFIKHTLYFARILEIWLQFNVIDKLQNGGILNWVLQTEWKG